jgi:ABC-type uncharacterized transport system involved in gliding motility auxiliary subunit
MTPHRKLLTGSALAVLAVLLVAVILVSNALFRGARLDLTQSHLYTLSTGTKKILSSIDEPIHFTCSIPTRARRTAGAAHVCPGVRECSRK